MSSQYKQKELIISRSHCNSVRDRDRDLTDGALVANAMWSVILAYTHHFCLPLTFPSCSVCRAWCLLSLSVLPLYYCLSIINVLISKGHISVMFPSHRQHPASLRSPPVTCLFMFRNIHMTLRSLMLENALMCWLSLEPGGSSTAGTNSLYTLLPFCFNCKHTKHTT